MWHSLSHSLLLCLGTKSKTEHLDLKTFQTFGWVGYMVYVFCQRIAQAIMITLIWSKSISVPDIV